MKVDFASYNSPFLRTDFLPGKVKMVAIAVLLLFVFSSIPNRAYSSSIEHVFEGMSSEFFDHSVENLNTHWTETLSLFPKRPVQTHPINRVEANKWIEAHPANQRSFARKFIDATEHVNQTVFEYHLKHTVVKFNNWLYNQASKDYCILVTNKAQQKSNSWVAELTLPFLSILPNQVFSYEDGEENKDSLVSMISYIEKKNITTIVLFDDASYSGSQLSTTVENINAHLSDYIPENFYKIVWIVPFITEIAKKTIYENSFSESSEVLLFSNRKIPILGDFFHQKECKKMAMDCEKTAIYFDHKIADIVSTFEFIYKYGQLAPGNIFANETRLPFIQGLPIVPPYKS